MGVARTLRTSMAAFVVAMFVTSAAQATVWTAYPQPDSTQYGFQQALDLAQPGDTVELMPGRYEDYFIGKYTGGNLTWAFFGFVTTPNLTIRSATSELATIGPATLTGTVGNSITTGIGINTGATGLVLDSLRIENLGWGVDGFESLTVTNCEFGLSPSSGAAIAVSLGNSLDVSGSLFLAGSNIAMIPTVPGGVVNVSDCRFQGRIFSAAGSAAADLNVTRTTFELGNHLNLSGNIHAVVTDCQFGQASIVSIVLRGADVTLRDCTFNVGAASIADIDFGSSLLAERCHFESSGRNMMFLVNFSSLEIHDSNILHGTNDYVSAWIPKSNNQPLRLTNNYWSESTETEIRQFIKDGSSFGDSTLVNAEILPIRDQRILPTQQTTTGSLKSLFRPRR